MGEGEILNTPHGRILKALINDGVRVGLSSRGVGNGRVDESGILVIGESYKLLTFDAVADPSTHSAFQEKIVSKREDYIPSNNSVESSDSSIKNESRSIHKISKEALIACLGGIIEDQTKNIKSKIVWFNFWKTKY